MTAAQYGTVSDIEVVWTLIAVFGVTLSVHNVRAAWGDYRAAANVANGRRFIASTTLRVECSRLVIQGIFVAIGILAMLIPDAPAQVHQPWQYVALGIVFRWGLVVSALLITAQSWLNHELRKRLLE